MYINNYLGNHNDMYSFFLVNPRINREPHYYTFFVFTYLVYLTKISSTLREIEICQPRRYNPFTALNDLF